MIVTSMERARRWLASACPAPAAGRLRAFRQALAAAMVVEVGVLYMSPHGMNHARSASGFNLRYTGLLAYIAAPQGMLDSVATATLAAAIAGVGLRAPAPALCASICALWSVLWLSESVLYNNHYYLYSCQSQRRLPPWLRTGLRDCTPRALRPHCCPGASLAWSRGLAPALTLALLSARARTLVARRVYIGLWFLLACIELAPGGAAPETACAAAVKEARARPRAACCRWHTLVIQLQTSLVKISPAMAP